MATKSWPERLWLVRHGQSAGNVAQVAADLAGDERVAFLGRDVDVPLSPLGAQQALALGRWFGAAAPDARPDVILSSPYVRALQTAQIARDAGAAHPDTVIGADERLREKEFGILDGLTQAGVVRAFPEQADLRRVLGKFYHRPPGGESWCDVIFRLRAVLDTVSLHHGGRRVIIFAHHVVVLCMRYIIENMNEAEVLAIDASSDVANCAITEYRFDGDAGGDGALVLAHYNITAPMEAGALEVTRANEAMVGARG